MGGMLCSGCGDVLEPSKSAGDVARHGDVDVSCVVIPGQSEAAVEGAVPFSGDCVELAQCVDEMLGVVFADILDAEVIDNKGERDGAGSMTE